MKRLVILVLGIILSTNLLAQKIADDDMGIEFTPPEGWQATKKEVGYLMGSAHTQGFMLLRSDEFKSIKALKSAMKKGIQQEDGSLLKPTKDLAILGDKGVSGMYSGTIDGTEMTGFMMALMPEGKGLAAICISVAPTNNFNQSNIDQIKLLMRNIKFK